MSQPVLFGELAIMLWLLIKGAKVPTLPARFSRRQPDLYLARPMKLKRILKWTAATILLALVLVVLRGVHRLLEID